jgi:hypothetical protein
MTKVRGPGPPLCLVCHKLLPGGGGGAGDGSWCPGAGPDVPLGGVCVYVYLWRLPPEHSRLYHFACLALHGCPKDCGPTCFRHLLLRSFMERTLTNCWQIDDVHEGALTGWIVDYNYSTKHYDVLFDTGVRRSIRFDDGG